MSSFSMRPQLPTGGSEGSVSTEQWAEWGEYLHTLIKADEVAVAGKKGKTTRTKTQVGILNFIMDMGFQPQADGQYDTKCALPLEGEEYSQEELAHIEKYPTNDFIWAEDDKGNTKRKQTAPKRPEQEYAFFFDFPEVMVDWTKHPNEDMHKLGQKPLRVSYNGRFGKTGQLVFNRTLPFTIDFKTKVLGSKNPIYKIADKMGVAQAFEASGYDLGVLAGKACKWSVISEKNVSGDKTFYNVTIKDASKIEEVVAGDIKVTVEQQIPKCDVQFVGVHFNAESYDPDTIEYIKNRKELIEVVQRATSFKPSPVNHPDFVIGCEFKDSGLAKALGTVAPQEEEKKASLPDAPPKPTPAEFDSFDDDIPF
jgi:hypothetical protein